MPARHRNDGLRKLCTCPRRKWPKCHHPWHFNFRWAGQSYRFSLDKQLGRHVATKSDAKTESEKLRAAIREGTFQDDGPVLDGLTVGQLFDQYFERYIMVKRPNAARDENKHIRQILQVVLPLPTRGTRPFGEWVVSDVTTDTIERFREVRKATGGGAVAINRNLQLVRACFNWGIRVGYFERTPFKRGTEAVIKLTMELPRHRRLEPGEGEALLAACDEGTRAKVEGALETGMRQGELLSLQWKQVRTSPAEIFIPAEKAKQRKDRRIPISSRLQAILEMRRLGPDRKPQPPTAFVFGNEVGERDQTLYWDWKKAVLKANGLPPLPRTYHLQYRSVDLRFHDLRREAGSRWLEGGVPLHVVRDWLGHANISQTSTYLAGTSASGEDFMRKFEESRLQTIANSSGIGHLQPQSAAAYAHEKH